MQIVEVATRHFGALRRFQLTGLGSGLVLLEGPNEAGKSTLLDLLRSVLFGFPKKGSRYRRSEDEPLHGRIVLQTDDGQSWIVERQSRQGTGQLRLTARESDQQAPSLRDLLGFEDPQLFTSLFSFDLKDLEALDLLRGEAASSRLYSVGLGIDGASLSHVLKELQEAKQTLWRPGGQKPTLNQTLNAWAQIEMEIATLQHQADGYNALLERLSSAKKTAAQLEQARHHCQQEIDELRLLRSVEEDWAAWREAQQALADLPQRPDFPQEAIARLERLEAEEHSQQEACSRVASRRHSLEERLAQLATPFRYLPQEARWRQLLHDYASILSALQEAETRELPRYFRAQHALQEAIHTLGPAFDEARVVQVTVGVALEDAIARYQADRQTAQSSYEQALFAVTQQQLALEEAQRQADAAAHLSPSVSMPRRWLPVGIAVLGIGAGGGLGRFDLWAGAVVAIGALSGAILWWRHERQQQISSAAQMHQAQQRVEMHRLQYEQARQHCEQASKTLENVDEAWEQTLLRYRLPASLSPQGARTAAQQILLARQALVQRQESEQQIAQLLMQWGQWQAEWQQLSGESAAALPDPLQGNADPVTQLQRCLQVAQKLQPAVTEREDQLQAERERTGQQAALQHTLQTVTQEEQEAEAVLEITRQAIASLLSAGLGQPTTPTQAAREAFRRLAQQQLERERWLEQRENALRRLQLRLGPEQVTLEKRWTALEETPIEERAQRLRELEQQRDTFEQQARQAHDALIRLEEEEARMKQAERLETLLAQREALRATADAQIASYLSLAAQEALLRKTKEHFEKERQPYVLQETGRYLDLFTAGRYTAVRVLIDQPDHLFAEDAHQEYWEAMQLSRGTREQLYLALRLALIDELCSHGIQTPVLIDDVLVNFDPQRLKRFAHLMAQWSAKGHQVLLFTCHPEVSQALCEAVPTIDRHTLPAADL
ncbi:MAG: AAA family ATPase [Firmicutes bacterium]|nr:AAA family ATPase [Bacillota bacterium]